MSDIERRMLCKEVRVDMKDGKKKIRGYAAVFNQLSGDLGGFREQLSAGAFTDALATSDVRALINHDSNLVLGRSTSGTLTMREDSTGLAVEITPPDTQAARDLISLMERGDVSQMSFAFTVAKEDQTWQRQGEGPWIRTIKRVNGLYDVSVVTYPAYAQTTAAVRALEEVQAGEAQEALAAAKEVHKRESRKRQIHLAERAI
jgi:HK97 family phage prohead protease